MTPSDPFRVTRAPETRRGRPRAVVPEHRAEEVLTAIRRWHELHGEPPTLADWEPSRARARGQAWRAARFDEGDWPTTRIVRYHFGTMSEAIFAAGLKGRRRPSRVRPHLRSADSVLEAIHAWVEIHGEPPAMADWDPARARKARQWWRVSRYYEGDWPSIATVRHNFGSLNAAVQAAGYSPRARGRHALRAAESSPPAQPVNDTAAILVLRIRAVGAAQRRSDHTALASALRDLSSACLNWADRLAA